MNWYTAEFQSNGSSASVIPFSYTDKPHAEAKFHEILSTACLSNVAKHGAIMFCDDDYATLPRIESYEHGDHLDTCAWIVMEFQFNGETFGTIPFSYSSQNEAESKYHQLLSVAAVSSVNRHGAICFSDNGFIVDSKCYAHEEQQEEPEEQNEM